MSTETVTFSPSQNIDFLNDQNSHLKPRLAIEKEQLEWENEWMGEFKQEIANATEEAKIYKVRPCVSYDIIFSTDCHLERVREFVQGIPRG
jgi:hypothetical protein